MANYDFFQNSTCEYFPCHKCTDTENFSCLFCYCPLYALGDKCGGNFTYTKEGIKDCSGCLIPHSSKGYGYIIDETGMIIAHRDASQNGSSLTDTEEGRALLQNIRELGNGSFEMTLNGERSTVFVRRIMDQWTVVIVVSNAELYAEIRQQMVVNILICVVIFILIAFFYYRGYRNEQNYSRRMEEMKMEEQQQAYETKMLKMAKEASDQANQAKSDFLAEMSHEIRTPINAVLGMNEMVLRESARALDMTPTNNTADAFSHIHTYARDIESAGNSLLSIINDILDFSKIEAGRLEIEEHGYRLSAVLNDVTNMIFFRAKDKGLDFTVDVDKSVPDGLYGDHVRFRQVLTNLLNNAVKYTDHGRICLKVSREAGEVTVGKSVTLVMAVSDTGIGIREEDIGKLFTKFQRVDMKRNSTVEGTGLGLAITQSLVAMMGGEIRVESTYGKGSTFTVVLPQRVEVIEPIKDFQRRFESARSGSDAYRASFHAPNARILIVDDTRMNLVVAKGLLKDTEIGIDVAISGAEAIELAKSVWYDLILMDQRMPEMNGTEVMRLIQEQPDGLNKTTPVICVTADAVIGARERYLAQGFVDYLTKPIDSQKLEKLLVRYLPADKVVLQTLEAATKPQETSDDGFSYLYAAGIDPQIGLGYCQGNAALYQTLLKEYLDGSAKRLDDLDRYYDAGDWMNYGIVVHALKSGSRMIGAQALSERAAALEAAADRGDADAIRREHPQMMEDCRKLADALALHIDMSETNAEDGEVLEFMPE